METAKNDTKQTTNKSVQKEKLPFFSFGQDSPSSRLFFQPKLTINTPGDAFEQQADSVAEQVVNSSVSPVISPVSIPSVVPSNIQKDEEGPRQEEQEPLTDGLGLLWDNLRENNPLFPPFLDRLKLRLWDQQPDELKNSIIGFGVADALILGTVFAMDPRFRNTAINALDGVNLMTPIRLIPNAEFFTPSSFTYHVPEPSHPSYEFNGEFDLTPYFDFLHEHNSSFPQISPRFGLNLDYNPASQSLRVVGGTFNLGLFNRAITLEGGVNQFYHPDPTVFMPSNPIDMPVTSMLTLPSQEIRDTRFSIMVDVPRLINVIRGVPDTEVYRKEIDGSNPGEEIQRTEANDKEREEVIQKKQTNDEEREEEIQRKETSSEEQEEGIQSKGINEDKSGALIENEITGIENISRKAASAAPETSSLHSVEQALSSNGNEMDQDTRLFMEERFQKNFSDVKIHDDSKSHQSSKDINALAYTHQNHIVFGAGQYQPGTQDGKKLLAHELTHVVQQAGTIQKQEDTSSASDAPQIIQTRFITDDSVEPTLVQMRKSDFLRNITEAICVAVDAGLQGTEFSSDNCPYIRVLFARIQNTTPLQLEQMIARFQPLSGSAQSAAELIQFVVEKVNEAVVRWLETRTFPDIQEGISEILGNSLSAASLPVSGTEAESSSAGSPDIHLKAESNGINKPDSPQKVLHQLGKGNPMNAGTRSDMETAFQTDFSDVRIHTDNNAGNLAGSMDARAFAVGSHIAFAGGEFSPGTLIGDALIAHELAHVQQQKGFDIKSKSNADTGIEELETDADNSAVHAVAGIWRRSTNFFKDMSEHALPRLKSGLRLQSCGGVTREDKIAELEETSPPEHLTPVVEAPVTSTPTVQAEQNIEYLDLSSLEFQPVNDSDSVLYILSGPTLYILPASGIVQTPLRVRGQTTPQRGPFFSMPAVGHAGLHLIQTGEGTGVLFDAAGTRQGQPQILLPASLQALRTRFGITQITGAMLSHGHADHVSSLPLLISSGQINASQVIVHAGLESVQRGPLARVWTQLRSSSFTSLGYGPGWNPTSLQTAQIGNPASPTLTTTITIGTARFEILTLASALQQHAGAIQRGGSGSSTADAASLLSRISQANATYDITIVGDLRGRDLLRLHDSLGTTEFNRFFQNTRVLTGLHHLGAVSTADDVRGLQRLMEAVGASRNPITVISQTGSSMNTELVRMLQQSGVRVIALPDLDPARLRTVIASSAGPVRAEGAREFGAEPIVSAAQQRIAHLERTSVLLESLGSLPFENYGRTGTGMAAALRVEATRLSQLISQRITDSLNQLNSTTRTAGFDERIRLNNVAIERLEGAEALLGQSEIQRLSRIRPQAEEIRSRLEAARRSGEYSARLRTLIAEVGPQTARELLIDPLGQPMSVRQQRRVRRAAEAALGRQARAMRALTTRGSSPMPARARGAAWFGIAMELWNIAGPMIEQQVEESRRREQLDFYRFLGSLIWWGEKGLSTPVVGDTGGSAITDPALLSLSIQRRQYDDLPRDRRDQISLPQEVLDAQPLRRLYIPPPSQWTNQSVVGEGQIPPDTFWELFSFWSSAHIQNYDDFAAEFLDHSNAPIRPVAGTFGSRRWEIQWGEIGTDGHVSEQWEQSDRLSTIMNATENRVRTTTTNLLADQWQNREEAGTPRYAGPSIGAASPSPAHSSTRPTNMVRLLRGSQLYTYFNGTYMTIPSSQIEEPNDFSFFVFQNDASPTSQFLLIRAADFETYTSLRGLNVWRMHSSIEIPRAPASIFRDPANVYFDRPEEIPLERYISNPEERRALEIVRASQRNNRYPEGFFYTPYSLGESGVFRGRLDVWVNVRNDGAFAFARRVDIHII